MSRRCKCGCRTEIRAARQCTDYSERLEKMGFASEECQTKVGLLNLKKIQTKNAKKAAGKINQEKKAINKRNSDFKAKVKGNDLTNQLKQTQKIFNRMRKLEELYRLPKPACISCQKPARPGIFHDFACGHFKTVGSFPELRFNTLNTWLQCNQYCNCRLSGNLTGNKNTVGYIQGLKNRFDGAEKLMRYLERPHKNYTRDCESLKVVRAWCAGRIKQLEKDIASKF